MGKTPFRTHGGILSTSCVTSGAVQTALRPILGSWTTPLKENAMFTNVRSQQRIIEWIFAGAVGALCIAGCAEMEGEPASADESASMPSGESANSATKEAPSDVTESTESALTVGTSISPDVAQPYYAKATDTFFMDLPNWRIHNNGCLGTCDVNLASDLYTWPSETDPKTWVSTLVSGKYRGPDARDYDWPMNGVRFSVERKGCFSIVHSAFHIPHGVFPEPKYCWTESSATWEPKGDAAAIGTSQSIYKKQSTDFDITVRFRLRWEKTTMDGLFPPKDASKPDDSWHRLPMALWGGAVGVTAVLSTFDNQNRDADTDLYTAIGASQFPTETSYACRPYLARLSTETCVHSGMTNLTVGVHNFGSNQTTYNLTITPRY
jgi:hypothetical protein